MEKIKITFEQFVSAMFVVHQKREFSCQEITNEMGAFFSKYHEYEMIEGEVSNEASKYIDYSGVQVAIKDGLEFETDISFKNEKKFTLETYLLLNAHCELFNDMYEMKNNISDTRILDGEYGKRLEKIYKNK